MSELGNMPKLLGLLDSEPMPSDAMRVFADNLRRLRAAAKLTQQQLADISGVARPTIADYERGAAANVELKTITILAGALKCEPNDLVRELPAGFVVVGDLIDEYLQRWRAIDKPTEAEERWLRGIPAAFWFGGEATPDSVHDLVTHFRQRKRAP